MKNYIGSQQHWEDSINADYDERDRYYKSQEQPPQEQPPQEQKVNSDKLEKPFYCNQDDGKYNNNPCAEQCSFCR